MNNDERMQLLLDRMDDDPPGDHGRDMYRIFGEGPTLHEVLRMSKSEMLTPYGCGCIPLRHAIRGRNASIEVCRFLLQNAPESAHTSNRHGNIALTGIRPDTPLDVARLLVEATPKYAMMMRDDDGDLPLHCLLQNHVHPEVLLAVIKKCPATVFTSANKQGRLPLHEAVRESAPVEVMQLLLSSFSSGALVCKDGEGRYPVHYIGSSTSMEVAELLVGHSPPWTLIRLDKRGRSPLHSAVISLATPEAVQFLLQSTTNSLLGQPDLKGMLPLHSIIDCSCSTGQRKHELLQLLLAKSGNEVFLKSDGTGRLPLHCIRHPINEEDIHLLIKRSGESALQRLDFHGRTPLHRILENRHVTIAMVDALTPPSVPFGEMLVTADMIGRTMLHAAIHGRVRPEVIMHMLSKAGNYLPQALTMPDTCGKLPLHCLLDSVPRGNTPVRPLLRALIGPFPSTTLTTPDSKGRLALHWALLSRAPKLMVQMIVDLTPVEAHRTRDNRGHIPLDCAIEQGTSVEIVELLVSRMPPEYLRESDEDGKTLLHRIQRSMTTQVVCLLARHFPDLFAITDRRGRLALHYALEQRVSLRVIEAMLEVYPEAVQKADNEGDLPVHLVGRTRSSVALRIIALSGRQAILARNNFGQNALHRAVERNGLLDVVSSMVELCPEAIVSFDSAGRLPLHYDLDRPSPVFALMLVRQCPESLRLPDPQGRLPIHLALLHRLCCDSPVFSLMVELLPESLHYRDGWGRLPLHYAVTSGLAETQFLLERFSGAVNCQDNNGLTPLQVACEANVSVDVVYTLFRQTPVFQVALGTPTGNFPYI